MKGLGTGGETWSGTMTQYCDGPLVAVGADVVSRGRTARRLPVRRRAGRRLVRQPRPSRRRARTASLPVEAVNAAAHFGNSTAASNRYAQYVVLSAPGLDPDYYQDERVLRVARRRRRRHAGDLAFTNMPYVMDVGWSCGQGFVNTPGTNDGYSIVEGHEYAETITDQIPIGGWTDSTGGEGERRQVRMDRCGPGCGGQRARPRTGSFAMQSTFSNDTDRCDIASPDRRWRSRPS